jgi:hypothetical protein
MSPFRAHDSAAIEPGPERKICELFQSEVQAGSSNVSVSETPGVRIHDANRSDELSVNP